MWPLSLGSCQTMLKPGVENCFSKCLGIIVSALSLVCAKASGSAI